MLLISSSTLLIALSISLLISSSPLTMGFWILLIALMTSWTMGILFNSWFAIIIFLIYIGGMLVMFAYFSALTPNKPLNVLSMKNYFLMASFIIFPILVMPHNNLMNLMSMSPSLYPTMTILFSPSNSILLLIMASILFLILVTVVKIASIFLGPLRPFNYV